MLLFDSGFNGAVGDWIVANFIRYNEWSEGLNHYYTETFAWGRLKAFITIVAIGMVILWTVTIILAYILSRKGHAKRVSEETAKHILDQLSAVNSADRPAKEYAHIEQHIESIQNLISDSNRLMLEEVNKKNDLIAYLAHDLKTPLTSIIGYLSLLQDEPQISPELRAKYTGIALDKALRLEDLINEFFDITDGEDTCGGNPCAYIREILYKNKDLQIDVIKVGSKNELVCLTNSTGGDFYTISGSDEVNEFEQALEKAFKVPAGTIEQGRKIDPTGTKIIQPTEQQTGVHPHTPTPQPDGKPVRGYKFIQF